MKVQVVKSLSSEKISDIMSQATIQQLLSVKGDIVKMTKYQECLAKNIEKRIGEIEDVSLARAVKDYIQAYGNDETKKLLLKPLKKQISKLLWNKIKNLVKSRNK